MENLDPATETAKAREQAIAKAYAKKEAERLKLEARDRQKKAEEDKKRDALLDKLFKGVVPTDSDGRVVNPDYVDGNPNIVPNDSNPVPISPDLIRSVAEELKYLVKENERLEQLNRVLLRNERLEKIGLDLLMVNNEKLQ